MHDLYGVQVCMYTRQAVPRPETTGGGKKKSENPMRAKKKRMKHAVHITYLSYNITKYTTTLLQDQNLYPPTDDRNP